ncbi:MAG TPA: type III restriction endonuclease subunit R, partial [Blastocatellia bacterium]|nr:type III restriction endonuclease subunit R [Blastocatellia bacterium]
MAPEEKARQNIDKLLQLCGWEVQSLEHLNLSAARGVAVREVTLERGHGFADYLLFVDGKAIGSVEAKPEGHTLRGVEDQSRKYGTGLPEGMQSWIDPLPFAYESTGVETHFTNYLEPEARSREVFSFHQLETLLEWAQDDSTVLRRLREMPPLIADALWPAQIKAIHNLEHSFALN